MPWFKVDDLLHDHRKVRRLGNDRAPAMGVWVLCGSWAGHNLSDGFVPEDVVRRFDPRERYAERLVEVGLWKRAEQDNERGYRFHEWTNHQPTRDEVEDRRQKRAAAGRLGGIASGRRRNEASASAGGSASAMANGQADGKQNGGKTEAKTNPVPSRMKTSSSSANQLLADLGADDDEMTKVIDLIQERHKPTALGPYIRQLATNGDLAALLAEVRKPPAVPVNGWRGKTHAFDGDSDGACTRCPLPEGHPCHKHTEPAPAMAE